MNTLNGLIHLDVSLLSLFIRAVVVYLAVLLLLRISGKRQMGQMNATEFVAVLLISNAVQNSMNGGDNSLVGGLFLAVVLIALSSLIAYLTYKSKFCSAIFEGTPTLLIHRGQIIRANVKKELLSEGELKTLLRKQGFHDFNEIEIAIWEADGTLSITGKTSLAKADVVETAKDLKSHKA
ncbi:MAG: DUF421 domain-containing protein [Rhizobacter sp.]|nr:DUF421 domain-containing protein [Bacteriovorax sp.]